MAVNVNNSDQWLRPWNIEKFDDLYNRDERFFAILVKGMLSWLDNNIVLYNKPVKHFIFNTGSSYMYIESNGYQFSWNETSGEDAIYMQMPRCIVELGSIRIPTEELTSPFIRGTYERRSGQKMKGYNANIRRVPIEMDINLKYVLSNFNESIILLQEVIDKLVFQKYFKIAYLGQEVQCSIEFPQDFTIELNKIDMTDPTTNQKNLLLAIKICSNYPCVDETTEIANDNIISKFDWGGNLYNISQAFPIKIKYKDSYYQVFYNSSGNIISNPSIYDEDGNELAITDLINNGEIIDENGNSLSEHDIHSQLYNNIPIDDRSTLFFGDITNTVDIISRENILK